MLYPAELRGRYLTVYLWRTADAMTGKKQFLSRYGGSCACRPLQLAAHAPEDISIVRLNP